MAGFNPRTREGATVKDKMMLARHLGFNPRTREGATELNFFTAQIWSVSIHAPVRVRPGLSGEALKEKLFQSTHP